MKICVAGAAGAFGVKHLDALAAIDGVEVVSVVGGKAADIEALAAKRAIPHADKSLDQALARPESRRSFCRRRPRCTPPRRSPA